MYLTSVGMYSRPRVMVMLKANTDNIAMGIMSLILLPQYYYYITYLSISLFVNVLLTLMIVVRLVLHSWNTRTATGSPAGTSGLYKSIATMLIESSALFAVSSLITVVLWTIDHPVGNAFPLILSETQVCGSPPLRSLDRSSHVTTELTDHCITTHHSTSRQQERVEEQHYCPRESQPRGVDWRRCCPPWWTSHEVCG